MRAGKVVIKLEVDYDYTELHVAKKDMKQLIELAAKRAKKEIECTAIASFTRFSVTKTTIKDKSK